MPEVPIRAQVSEEFLHRYEGEARRQGVKVEALVEKTVNTLLQELEREEEEFPSDTVMPS